VPRRNSYRLQRNASRDVMLPLLADIAELRQAYESAPATMVRCEDLVRTVSGRLKKDAVCRALDQLLTDEQRQRALAASPVTVSEADLEDEIKLAADFGYSGKDVKRYVRRASRERPATHQRDIANTEDLIRELRALHDRAEQEMTATGGPVRRLRHPIQHVSREGALKRAREDAQHRLYCIGTIIADVMIRDLFAISYAVGSLGLESHEPSVPYE
jgi:hypothetical protein